MVLILAIDPELFISINELLSIIKLIVPPSSPTWAPTELLALLKSNSAPVVVSPTSLKSNTPLGSLVPIPTRGLIPEALIVSAFTSLAPPADCDGIINSIRLFTKSGSRLPISLITLIL